jgi:hypothetical protein
MYKFFSIRNVKTKLNNNFWHQNAHYIHTLKMNIFGLIQIKENKNFLFLKLKKSTVLAHQRILIFFINQ